MSRHALRPLTAGCFCICVLWLSGSTAHAQDELKRMDRNGDGNLEKSEVPEQAWRFVEKYAERAGLNPEQPLPIDRLEEAIRGRREEENRGDDRSRDDDRSSRDRDDSRDRDRDRDDSRSSSSRKSSGGSSSNSAVPGFGETTTALPLVPGFDVPLSTGTEKPVEQVFDPRAIDRARKTLRENDRDGSGYLDGDEIDRGRWTNPPVEESDLDKDGRLSLYELCGRYAKRYGWNDAPGVIRSSSSGSSDSRGDSRDSGGGDKVRSYAESLLKQYDENKDGLLQKDEWSKMRSDYHSADQNGDSVLTIDEIYVKLSALSESSGSSSSGSGGSSSSGSSSSSSPSNGYSRYGGRSSSGGSSYSRDRGSSSSSSGSSKSDSTKTTRFLTPTERLPKGLPEWFLRNDADGDGQILMSEYAASWTESAAAEFNKYDLDNDGFVTPDECLKAMELMKKK